MVDHARIVNRWRLFTSDELATIESLVYKGAEHLLPAHHYEEGYERVDRLKAELLAAAREREGENFAASANDQPPFTTSPRAELPGSYCTGPPS